MVRKEYIDQVVGLQGYRVGALHFGEGRDSGEKESVIGFARTEAGYPCRCGRVFNAFLTLSMIVRTAWCLRGIHAKIEPLKKFARML